MISKPTGVTNAHNIYVNNTFLIFVLLCLIFINIFAYPVTYTKSYRPTPYTYIPAETTRLINVV